MKKIQYIILFIALLLLLDSCGNKKSASVWDMVPHDAVLVVEANHDKDMLSALAPFSASADVLQSFENQLNRIDSLFSKDPKSVQKLHEAKFAVVMAPVGNTIGSSLVYVDENKLLSDKELQHVMEGNGLYCENLKKGKLDYFLLANLDTVYAFVQHSHLVFSSSENLLLSMFEQLGNPLKIYDNPDFQRINSTVGNAVPLHLYLNYEALGPCLVSNASSKSHGTIERFVACFKGMAAMDVLSKPDVLVMNGYSIPTDSLSSLRPLKYQLPVYNSVVNVLPFNTKLMLHFGMSDYASYWEEFVDKELVEKWNKSLKADVEEQLVACLSEVSICAIGSQANVVFVARMNDPVAVSQFMERLGNRNGIIESIVNQGYTIKKLNVKEFVPDVFGSCFGDLKSCSYSIIDQYLVIANDIQQVQDLISCYRSGRTLDLSENFKAFQNNMLESANVSLFVACSDNQKLIDKYVGGDMAAFLKRNKAFLPSYQAFSIQLASAKDLVYTCFNLRKMTDVKEESNVQWKVNLDAPMKGKPYIVPDPSSNAGQVVVFDLNNTMYLIDFRGNVKWKRQIEESPMSAIEVVDYDKDGRHQFLFNTANYLELIDGEGNAVAGFPKRLLAEASNGLAVFDYDGNRNYRVLVCGVDKFVYNYDLQGDETEGWNRHRTEEVVTKPVQHLVADNKDFLIVTDTKGTARILDRQGRIRIPLCSDLKKSLGADFYENKTNRKGIVLTSDVEGNLLYIANDGGLARTEFGHFSDQHYFLYEDFNGDQDPDFIYLDGKELRVFNRFKKVLYSHDFDTEIKTKPVFYRLSRNKRLLGIVSEGAREIYLIDKNGNMMVSSGLVGETEFAIGSLKGNNEVNLLTGVGNALFNYLIY